MPALERVPSGTAHTGSAPGGRPRLTAMTVRAVGPEVK